MKRKDFVNKCIDIAKNYKTLYVYGCFGSPMNESNKYRYTHNYPYNMQTERRNMILSASSDTFGFDCVNLIKGILWGWNGNLNNTYGGAVYGSNGVPDVNANDMFNNYCNNKSSDFSNIESGEFVWLDGHIGVYIGSGLVVECSPAFQNKVQITACENIGYISGYASRRWSKHGKSKFIDYTKEETEIQYSGHIENIGWSEWKNIEEWCGTTHESKRLEALRFKSKNNIKIKAKAHIQDIGYVDYGEINENTIIGTTHESKRLEALFLNINGYNMQVHIEKYGDSAPTKCDGICSVGSVGQSLRIEAFKLIKRK